VIVPDAKGMNVDLAASFSELGVVRAAVGVPVDALRLRGVAKSFGRRVVAGLDLTIRPGEFYALLGPNGAGKTTTLRMIAGLLKPDEGEIFVCGTDVRRAPLAAKAQMAWLPDEPLLYDRLTPLEYLEFVAGLWSVERKLAQSRAEALLTELGLWPHRGELCEGFSRGMRQKTALAGALLHDPQLLIRDEPLSGLDAAASRQVKDLLRARVNTGRTVILTTHVLEVAERLADRIGIIASGRMVAEGSFAELRDTAGQGRTTLEDIFLHVTAPEPALA
jgi:ABC-2 type transport system ATP-binding protein